MEHTNWKDSEELLKLGVPEESADVVFYAKIADQNGYVLEEEVWDPYIKKFGMPATKVFGWTPGALLELLPKRLKKDGHLYHFSLVPGPNSGIWEVSYQSPFDKILIIYEGASLIEILVSLIKWYYNEKSKI